LEGRKSTGKNQLDQSGWIDIDLYLVSQRARVHQQRSHTLVDIDLYLVSIFPSAAPPPPVEPALSRSSPWRPPASSPLPPRVSLSL
jgi:hypothetical protein